MDKMVNLNIFVKTAIITTLIFGVGVWTGLWLGDEKITSLESTMNSLQDDINNAELQFLMFDALEKNASCNYMIQTANSLGEESGKLASEVEKYENTQKIDDAAFYILKRKYTNTLIRDWLTLEKIKRTCNGSYSTILYFYSNKQCDKCEDQGIILTYLKEKLDNELLVFALDADIGVAAVDALRDSFGITAYPSTVINGKVHNSFIDKEDATKELCEFNSDFAICS